MNWVGERRTQQLPVLHFIFLKKYLIYILPMIIVFYMYQFLLKYNGCTLIYVCVLQVSCMYMFMKCVLCW